MSFSKIKQSFLNFRFNLECKFWEIVSAIKIRLAPVKVVISKSIQAEFNMLDDYQQFRFIDYCAVFDRSNIPYVIKTRIGYSGSMIYHNPKYVSIQKRLSKGA
ncbi:hypothetical protein [Candidatus Lokiarchaeum ossiferum]|uniref:hypothetical protein n=1 Tax=Candidatus Lokiarchaeum ossiferum TaxID=2951803 RepID=UPI00352D49AE